MWLLTSSDIKGSNKSNEKTTDLIDVQTINDKRQKCDFSAKNDNQWSLIQKQVDMIGS